MKDINLAQLLNKENPKDNKTHPRLVRFNEIKRTMPNGICPKCTQEGYFFTNNQREQVVLTCIHSPNKSCMVKTIRNNNIEKYEGLKELVTKSANLPKVMNEKQLEVLQSAMKEYYSKKNVDKKINTPTKQEIICTVCFNNAIQVKTEKYYNNTTSKIQKFGIWIHDDFNQCRRLLYE